MRKDLRSRGFTIMELLVSAAIIVAVVTAAAGAWQLYFKVLRGGSEKTQTALLTEEAAEALFYLRDRGWTANIAPIPLDTAYYLSWNWAGDLPVLSPTRSDRNGYSVQVAFTAISRDTNSNIAFGPSAVLDPSSRMAYITISPYAEPSKVILQTVILIHDFFKN